MAKTTDRNILLEINRSSDEPLYHQVYAQLRHAVRNGTLQAGDRLPSIRALCRDLGISHITIEKAYLQLAVEGYVENLPRSGFVVQKVDVEYFKNNVPDNRPEIEQIVEGWRDAALRAGSLSDYTLRYDFSYYNLAARSFPDRIWTKLTNESLLSLDATAMSRYPLPCETSPLQRALADYLHRTRGVNCLPEQIVVTSGSEAALLSLLQLFDERRDLVAHEEPGWNVFLGAARRSGFMVAPLPTDRGMEAYFGALDLLSPRIVFSTPSHQYPTGSLMGLDARIELLKRAAERGFYVIEDDSCNEYRYDTDAIPALQSLDTANRTVYIGNFSKVLSPALRVAYMVLPPDLLRRWSRSYSASFTAVPLLTQDVLARFIDGGHLDRQVRRMTTANHARHDRLVRCLETEMGDRLALGGIQSGMHLYVEVRNGMNQDRLINSALQHNVMVYKTDQCWFSRPADPDKVMIGFSAIDIDDIAEGVRRMRLAWFGDR